MASPNKSASPAAEGNSSSPKENVKPISSRIAELNESRSELQNRIQSLKQELAELKKSLNTEGKQQLRTLHDVSKDAPTIQDKESDQSNDKDGNVALDPEDKPEESPAGRK